MNPHQKNKIDISKMSEEEQKIFRLYGKVPSRGDLLQNKLKERKYFDSGDYALSKAGKASDVGVTSIGSQHPLPENIPHLSSPGQQQSGSSANMTSNNGGNNGSGGNGSGNGNGNSLSTASYGVVGANGQTSGTSPVRDGSLLTRSISAEDSEQVETGETAEGVLSPGKEVPSRWQS